MFKSNKHWTKEIYFENQKFMLYLFRLWTCSKTVYFKLYMKKKRNKKYHISICNLDKGFNLNKQQNGSTTSNFSNSQNNILLQTPFAEVSDLTRQTKTNVNILFDSGSRHTYISSDLRKSLKLQTLRTERIFLKSFGNKSSSVTTMDIVALKIINAQKIVTIEAISTRIICADLINQNIPYITSNYPL